MAGKKTPSSDKKKKKKPEAAAAATTVNITQGSKNRVKTPNSTPEGIKNRQEQFCLEYVKHMNGAKAYVDAGFSAKGAAAGASRLLANVNIQARIIELKKSAVTRLQNRDELDLSHDRILQELAAMAFSSLHDFLRVDKSTGEVCIDIRAVMEEAPHKLHGLAAYEVVEMPPVETGYNAADMGLTEELMKGLGAGMDSIGGIIGRRVLKHKIKLDKLAALELLMKHKNMFNSGGIPTVEELERIVEVHEANLAQRRAALMARLGGPLPVREAEFSDDDDDDD